MTIQTEIELTRSPEAGPESYQIVARRKRWLAYNDEPITTLITDVVLPKWCAREFLMGFITGAWHLDSTKQADRYVTQLLQHAAQHEAGERDKPANLLMETIG